MKEIELKIIQCIKGEIPHTTEHLKVLFEEITQQPMGFSSEAFIYHPKLAEQLSSGCVLGCALKESVAQISRRRYKFFVLRIEIELYLKYIPEHAANTERLSILEDRLKACLQVNKDEMEDKKTQTDNLLPEELANPEFINKLFAVKDEKLINLFMKHLPWPKTHVFPEKHLPDMIAKREAVSEKYIKDVVNRNESKLTFLEDRCMTLQRLFRARLRNRENLKRISTRYNLSDKEAKELIQEANTPYVPKCDKDLAARILNATSKIELFTEVCHYTAPSALESIFNNGLLGRRTLLQSYIPFKPASLASSDVLEGDANVICFAPFIVDPKARQGIQLIFGSRLLTKNNPCVFYKQKDFCYEAGENFYRQCFINYQQVSFTLKNNSCFDDVNACTFSPFFPGEPAFSTIKNALLMANDLKKMHQLLTLNFFRFLDNTTAINNGDCKDDIQQIYSQLNDANDKELTSSLESIGHAMTRTMELNFYGAHQIDFSTLLEIKKDQSCRLRMPEFIKRLQAGDLAFLQKAKKDIPDIFKSYRFIHYLLSQTKHDTVVNELQMILQSCRLPTWLKKTTPLTNTAVTTDHAPIIKKF